jgi:hypothetical protein
LLVDSRDGPPLSLAGDRRDGGPGTRFLELGDGLLGIYTVREWVRLPLDRESRRLHPSWRRGRFQSDRHRLRPRGAGRFGHSRFKPEFSYVAMDVARFRGRVG